MIHHAVFFYFPVATRGYAESEGAFPRPKVICGFQKPQTTGPEPSKGKTDPLPHRGFMQTPAPQPLCYLVKAAAGRVQAPDSGFPYRNHLPWRDPAC